MELLDPTPVAEVRYGYRISDIRIFDLMFLIIVNVALFGEAIQCVTGFSYCDEIATIYLVVCAVFTNGGRRPDDGRLTRALWSVTCLYRQRQSETTAGDREKHDRPLQKSN